jgi:antitoxin (DNA-binding transcriptional repressor) of toxin-antitoxin stability system
MYMAVNISKFRLHLFQMADQALQGEPVEFIHKGVVFKVIPATQTSKLARLTRETVLAPEASVDSGALLKEMEAEWEKDWSEL